MSSSNTGESAHTKEEWEAIRPVLKAHFIDQKRTLDQVMKILKESHNFIATTGGQNSDEVTRQPLQDDAPQTSPSSNAEYGYMQTRSKKDCPRGPDCPSYIQIKPASESESSRLHESLASARGQFESYIHRFFNSKPEHNAFGSRIQQQVGQSKCYLALILCQELSLLPRKKKDIIKIEGTKKAIKEGGKEKISALVVRLLKRHLHRLLEGIEDTATPRDLPTIWSICRTLHGLSYQLGQSEGENSVLMTLFIGILEQRFTGATGGYNYHMRQALRQLLDVPADKMQDAIRLSSLCSVQALSSRLEHHQPFVLKAWADHFRHWGDFDLDREAFISDYRRAFKTIQADLNHSDVKLCGEGTVSFLIHCSHVAHYVFHDRGRAETLATLLWRETGALLVGMEPPMSWNIYIQGMVESIKIHTLLCYITHEDQLKDRTQLKKKKHKFDLYRKKGRRSLHPYNLEAQHIWDLDGVIEKMITVGEEDFLLLMAELHHLLESLWNINVEVLGRLETAVTQLSSINSIECQLLLAGLYEMCAFLEQATSSEIHVVFARAHWLWSKTDETKLSELDWCNLTTFLLEEEHTARGKAEEWRSEAKRIRFQAVTSEGLQ
ncbi:hypothetical protein FAUST_9987 [Fusarium austroamericanum]|uniref:Clr5 domain-containing protein n=1 Tax=Fusarium austroamericanum TaxID=282268 RepID=A0AAN6BVU5_FUSAU|nr:hypothetical protein FAUST_9987 [Fusarium austroamericanum]